MFGGAPDAVALNIYADGVFKPGDALWGIQQSEHEITGAFWRIKGQGGRILEPLEFDEDKRPWAAITADRKSTRLNSSHPSISYAVFCLKKKKNTQHDTTLDAHDATPPSRVAAAGDYTRLRLISARS